jgi:hypothetical protein
VRPIKFRAWDTKNKEMLKNGAMDLQDGDWTEETVSIYLLLNGGVVGFCSDDGGKSGLWEHEKSPADGRIILMQFTGLLDSKGREIYEGDIVEIGGDPNFRGAISYDEKAAMFCYEELSVLEALSAGGECEVIGNVWEHPSLLKEPK